MKKQKWSAIALIIAFFLYIGAISLWGILSPAKSFSEQENRFLQKSPPFSGKALLSGEFAEAYESFITDQFPMRNEWIGIKTMTEQALCKQEMNGVYFGRDGYLIEAHREADLDKEQMEENKDTLLSFVQKAAAMPGVERIKLILAPTADVILKEKLPPLAGETWQNRYLEEIRSALSGQGFPDCFVDVGAALSGHRQQDIFYRTDHHWTTKGAYYAYEKWAEESAIVPYPETAFTISAVSEDFYGTIQSKVNRKTQPDTLFLYEPIEPAACEVFYDLETEPRYSLYDMEKRKGKDKYAVFLGGNHGLVRILNQRPLEQERRLLIIKDSYANSFAPFAVNHFTETQMIDLRYFNMPIIQYLEDNSFTDILVLYNVPNFAGEKNIKKL